MTRLTRTGSLLVLSSLFAIALLVGGCGGDKKPTPTVTVSATSPPASGAPADSPSQTATPSPSATTTMVVTPYFLAGEKVAPAHRLVPQSLGVATAAMNALLAGPSNTEKAAGLITCIPDGSKLLGLKIAGGVATVDLSPRFESGGGTLSMTARLAQVVYTLTQFPTVKSVTFKIDHKKVSAFGGEGIMIGEPQTRADYEELTPAILVEWPAVGDTVTSPLVVKGTANVFEAVFQVQLVDNNGSVLAKKTVTASSGTGTRGTFATTLTFSTSASKGKLKAFSLSPKDGKPENVVTVPLTFAD